MEIRQEISTPDVPPFNVAEGHWNRHGSIAYSGDFLFIIHSRPNHQPISNSFRDKGDKVGALGSLSIWIRGRAWLPRKVCVTMLNFIAVKRYRLTYGSSRNLTVLERLLCDGGVADLIQTRADKRNFIAVAHVQGSARKTGQSFTVTRRHQIDRVPVTS